MISSKRIAAIGALGALAACSTGAQSIVPVSTGANIPLTSQPQSKTTGTAIVTLLWPKKAIAERLHPHFISPSTMSIIVETTGADGSTSTTIANNTGKAKSVTLSIPAPAGNDLFVVSLYDTWQRAGETVAKGNELGQATVAHKIVAGKSSTIPFTTDGIVSRLSIALASPGPLASVSGAPGMQTIELVGDSSETVTLTPLDADGNAIVAPGTLPTYTLASSGATGTLLEVVPVAKKANEFVVTPEVPVNRLAPETRLTLIATANDAFGSHTSNVVVTPINELFVGYASGGGAKIGVYDGKGTPVALPSGAFKGVTQPVGLAYDPDDHWLLVADASNKVLAFDPLGHAVSAFASPSFSGITAIAYYNDVIARVGTRGLKTNPRRVLVADAQNGFDELSMTGATIVSAGSVANAKGTAFTPTAIAGVVDDQGPSQSGAVVAVADPTTRSIDSYDMKNPNPTHSGVPLPSPDGSALVNGGTPSGLAAFAVGVAVCTSGSATVYSPVTMLLVATGSSGDVNSFEGLCGSGVFQAPNGSALLRGNVTAVTIDAVNGGFYTIDAAKNAIADYSFGTTCTAVPCGVPQRVSAGSFKTPAGTGLARPNSIAAAF